ncbi:MAG: flagellar hook-associated protein FlgL, partial [bacterium]
MSRVTFFSKFENTERILLNKSEEIDQTRRKLASGENVQKPSDDPSAIVDINRFSNQLDNIDQFKDNINNARNNLENSEGTMGKLSDVLQRVRELAVQGANDTLEDDARDSIQSEVNQRLEQVVNLANTQVGGQYLFSGSETTSDQPPFAIKRNGEGEIVEVNYQGDRNPQENQVSQGQTLAANITGNRLFQATNQGIVGDFELDYPGELKKNLSEMVGYQQLDSPPAAKTASAAPDDTGGPDSKTTLQISDASQFKVGETVEIAQRNGSTTPGNTGDPNFEETVVTRVDGTNNRIEVDLKNTYDTSGSNEVIVKSKSSGEKQTVTAGGDSGGGPSGGGSLSGGLSTSFGDDSATTFQLNNVDGLSAGDKVRVEDPTTNSSETRVVQQVNDGTSEITLDLSESTIENKYTGNTTVQKVAEPTTPNGEGKIQIDDEKFFYDTREDNILDIAKRINERGIEVQAKFIQEAKPQPQIKQELTENSDTTAPNELLKVKNASNFKEGQTVTLQDANNQEEAVVKNVDAGANTVTVDALENTYDVSADATISTQPVKEA